jgi:hypothetical protein
MWVGFGFNRAGLETESCRVGSFWKKRHLEKGFGPKF